MVGDVHTSRDRRQGPSHLEFTCHAQDYPRKCSVPLGSLVMGYNLFVHLIRTFSSPTNVVVATITYTKQLVRATNNNTANNITNITNNYNQQHTIAPFSFAPLLERLTAALLTSNNFASSILSLMCKLLSIEYMQQQKLTSVHTLRCFVVAPRWALSFCPSCLSSSKPPLSSSNSKHTSVVANLAATHVYYQCCVCMCHTNSATTPQAKWRLGTVHDAHFSLFIHWSASVCLKALGVDA